MAARSVGRSLSHFYLTYGILTWIGQSALTSNPNMIVALQVVFSWGGSGRRTGGQLERVWELKVIFIQAPNRT
jgi:hypothetical protein